MMIEGLKMEAEIPSHSSELCSTEILLAEQQTVCWIE